MPAVECALTDGQWKAWIMLMWGTLLLIGQWKGRIMLSKMHSHGQLVRILLNHVCGFGQWKGAMLEGISDRYALFEGLVGSLLQTK